MSEPGQTDIDPIVQYVILRKDLIKSKKWNLGAIVAQGCHASTAALWTYRNDPVVLQYCENLENMHKVILEAKDDMELVDIASTLKANSIEHVLWREQPENVITALATKPCVKNAFGTLLRHLRLLK